MGSLLAATSFLGGYFSLDVDPMKVLMTLLVALIVGVVIFVVYRLSFAGVMYSRTFNVSLIMLTLVTTLMLMLITDKLALSLGMVGALSIIRFRTAVKDPIDTVFMFWAVGEGVAIGAGSAITALIAVVFIGIVMILMRVVKVASSEPYLLIIHYDEAASEQIRNLLSKLPKNRLKSKTVRPQGVEIVVEIRLSQRQTGFVDKLLRVNGVRDASLITHKGDIVG